MVQLIANSRSESLSEKMAAVKMEVVEDSLEEEHGSLHKRPKPSSLEMGGFAVVASHYNPLNEPSPLGLRLRKSPSLLELIQMKLSQSSMPQVGSRSHIKKESKTGPASADKLKASNFPASLLRIGSWEYKSRYEGDLVAKCYFAKHKLVWEVLDGGLKNKIEIQWSDIMALKGKYSDDGPGTLDVVLSRQPLFFRETNPQPRKHTLWQATSDFTGEQASIHRRHYLECPKGLMGKHFEKLLQCDPRLNFLSHQGEITLDSPYFETRPPMFDDQNENNKEGLDLNREESSHSFFSLQDTTTSPSEAQSCTSKNDQDVLRHSESSYPHETPSPSSGGDVLTLEDIKKGRIDQLKHLSNWDHIIAPWLNSSMSMTDLVNHLEHRISEQQGTTPKNPTLSSEEWQSLQILNDINRCLFADPRNLPDSDEKSLVSRVNSLCSLLREDGNVQSQSDTCPDEVSNMSRKDSVGDLLLNLPRIASLPHFLFNLSGDFENQAR